MRSGVALAVFVVAVVAAWLSALPRPKPRGRPAFRQSSSSFRVARLHVSALGWRLQERPATLQMDQATLQRWNNRLSTIAHVQTHQNGARVALHGSFCDPRRTSHFRVTVHRVCAVLFIGVNTIILGLA